MRTTKILIRLRICAGWSESSLGALLEGMFSHVGARMISELLLMEANYVFMISSSLIQRLSNSKCSKWARKRLKLNGRGHVAWKHLYKHITGQQQSNKHASKIVPYRVCEMRGASSDRFLHTSYVEFLELINLYSFRWRPGSACRRS